MSSREGEQDSSFKSLCGPIQLGSTCHSCKNLRLLLSPSSLVLAPKFSSPPIIPTPVTEDKRGGGNVQLDGHKATLQRKVPSSTAATSKRRPCPGARLLTWHGPKAPAASGALPARTQLPGEHWRRPRQEDKAPGPGPRLFSYTPDPSHSKKDPVNCACAALVSASFSHHAPKME